jgi:hypothetical protein
MVTLDWYIILQRSQLKLFCNAGIFPVLAGAEQYMFHLSETHDALHYCCNSMQMLIDHPKSKITSINLNTSQVVAK